MKIQITSTIFAAMFFGCNVPSQKSNTKIEEKDTIEIAQEIPIEKQSLPDTIFSSAKNLVWNITYFDTDTIGQLSDYENVYLNTLGIFTFRGNILRNTQNFKGKVTGTPDSVEVVWRFNTSYDTTKTKYGTWGGGSGWTGQPLYAQWPDSIIQKIKSQSPALKDFGTKEIIVGSLCGKLYFINYESGKASREEFDVQNPIKGTPSIDPTLNGNIYVGQGVPRQQPFGCLCFNMFSHKQTFFKGNDSNAWRGWNAFDSSPVAVGGYLFWPSENGTIYKYKKTGDSITLHSTLRYKRQGRNAPGVESSICIFKNYGYFCDNHGNIICINLNTLKPIWHYNNYDDSDGTIVCKPENGVPYIYSGCEVDKQGTEGISRIVKLNGCNGDTIWQCTIPCKRMVTPNKTLDGGMYCTPLLGQGDCDSLIFMNICTNNNAGAGHFYAINTKNGKVEYFKKLKSFAWSSPVAFYNENNKMFIFTGDASGNVYLIDALTGKTLFTKNMAINFESSPVAIDNYAVVGSRGTTIYKFLIK